MKGLWMAALAVIISSAAAGQVTSSQNIEKKIVVEEYDRKVRSTVGQEIEVEAPAATTHPKCGEIKVEMKETIASGGCAGTLIRTYTYTDDCDNSEMAEIYIVRADRTGPVFDNLPGHVFCKRADLPAIPEVTATDANGMPVKITYEEREKGPILARMWTATDTCGNETQGMQRVTFLD